MRLCGKHPRSILVGVTAAAPPSRIVSLVPSMTESVCRLGAGQRLVGVTRYCEEPAAELRHLPRVGGTKNPKLEAIAALRPDLVLVNTEENHPEHIAWLRERMPVLEHCPRTVVQATQALRGLAEVLQAMEEARPNLLRIEAQIARAEAESLERAPVRVFYAVWMKPWMGANADTYIHDVLRLSGAVNVCAGLAERYPEVTPAAVRERGVEAVLLPSEPYPFGERDRERALAEGWFGEGVPVLLCDGRDFCWHGVRTADGLGNAMDLLLPLRRAR